MPTELLSAYFYNSLTTGFLAFIVFLFLGQNDVRISNLARKRIWIGLSILMLIPVKVVIPSFSIFWHSPVQRLYIALTNQLPTQKIIDNIVHFVNNTFYLGLTVLEIASLIWLIIAFLFFLGYVLNYMIFVIRVFPFCRKVRRQIHTDICSKVKNELGLSENYDVYFCLLIKQPVVIGFLKQKILIPYRKYSRYGFYFMVKRQMIHCAGKHLHYLFLIRLANAIHWFNPFSYKILEQYRRDIETLCQKIITIPLSKNGTKIYYETYYKEFGGFKDSFKFNNIFLK